MLSHLPCYSRFCYYTPCTAILVNLFIYMNPSIYLSLFFYPCYIHYWPSLLMLSFFTIAVLPYWIVTSSSYLDMYIEAAILHVHSTTTQNPLLLGNQIIFNVKGGSTGKPGLSWPPHISTFGPPSQNNSWILPRYTLFITSNMAAVMWSCRLDNFFSSVLQPLSLKCNSQSLMFTHQHLMTANQNTRIEKTNILREMWVKHFRRGHKEHLLLSLKSPSRQNVIAIYQFQFFDWQPSKCWSANETSNFEDRTSTIMVAITALVFL